MGRTGQVRQVKQFPWRMVMLRRFGRFCGTAALVAMTWFLSRTAAQAQRGGHAGAYHGGYYHGGYYHGGYYGPYRPYTYGYRPYYGFGIGIGFYGYPYGGYGIYAPYYGVYGYAPA